MSNEIFKVIAMNTSKLLDAIYEVHKKDYADVIEKSLKNGKINFANHNGVILLNYLVVACDTGVAQLLIEKGVDINAQNDKQETVLHLVARGNLLRVAELLIENGADVNILEQNQITALYNAVRCKSVETARLLIKKGANVHVRCKDQNTLLHWTACHDDPTMAGLLIEKGVDINAKNKYQRSTLDWAVYSKHPKIVQLLIEKGANLQIQNSDQGSLLHWAAENGYVQIVKLLLDKKEDVQARNKKQQTPFDLVIQHPQPAMLECLLPYQKPDIITQACDTLVNNMQRFFPNTTSISDKRMEGFKALMPYSMQYTLYFLENPEKNIDSLLEGDLQLRKKGLPQELIDLILEETYSIPEKLTAFVECLKYLERFTSLPTPPNQVVEVIQNKIEAMKPKTRDDLLTRTEYRPDRMF